MNPKIFLLLTILNLSLTSANAQEVGKTSLRVGYLPATHDSLLFIAYKQGFFHDLDIQLVRYTSSPDILNDMRGEKVDIGIPGVAAPIEYIAGGSPFKIIGGAAQESAAIVVRPKFAARFKEGMTVPEKMNQFNGMRVGSVKQSTGDALFRKAIKDNNLSNKIDLNDSYRDPAILRSDLKGEKLDGAVLWSPHMTTAEAEGMVIVLWTREILDNHVCCRQVVTDDYIHKHEDAISLYLQGLIRAMVFYSDPANKETVLKDVKSFVATAPEVLQKELYGEKRTSLSVDLNRSGIESYLKAMQGSSLVRIDSPSAVMDNVLDKPMLKAYRNLGLSEVQAQKAVTYGFDSVKQDLLVVIQSAQKK